METGWKLDSGMSKNLSLRNQLQMISSSQVEYLAKKLRISIFLRKTCFFSNVIIFLREENTGTSKLHLEQNCLFQEDTEVNIG